MSEGTCSCQALMAGECMCGAWDEPSEQEVELQQQLSDLQQQISAATAEIERLRSAETAAFDEIFYAVPEAEIENGNGVRHTVVTKISVLVTHLENARGALRDACGMLANCASQAKVLRERGGC